MSLNLFISSVPSQNPTGINSLNSSNSSLPSQNENRTLSEMQRDLLLRWCGSDSDPIIREAIRLFNARIVGINSSVGANRKVNRHVSERQLTFDLALTNRLYDNETRTADESHKGID